MVTRMSKRSKYAIRMISVILGAFGMFGLFRVVDNYLIKDADSSTAATDTVQVSLKEGDVVERIVTERDIHYRRSYSVKYDGTLVKFGLPTPYISTNTVGDSDEATVYTLCDAVRVINYESHSDHPERDTKQINTACSAAHKAYYAHRVDDCENNLLELGKLITARVTDKTILDYSFTNGNINTACGDEKGRSAALNTGTTDIPVLSVSMGK